VSVKSGEIHDPDGTQVRVGICAKLTALGISSKTATNLLREGREQGLIKRGEYLNWDARQVKARAENGRTPRRRGVVNLLPEKPDKPEDDEDEPEPEEPEHRHPRYSLVLTTSGFWGIWDELSFTQTLISRDKADAIRELKRLNRPQERLPHSWRLKEELKAA
jgi:hypothetical protein